MEKGENTPTLQEQKAPSKTEKKCVCGTPRTEEHNWKRCQYVRHKILGESYRFGFKVDEWNLLIVANLLCGATTKVAPTSLSGGLHPRPRFAFIPGFALSPGFALGPGFVLSR